MNKKAQGLSVTTIILVILGIIVLVILVLGFTVGWSKMKSWIVSSNNVDTIVNQCDIACSMGQTYGFCSEKRELKTEDETLKDTTCYVLAKKKTQYGIKECPAIKCGFYDDLKSAKAECSEEGETINYIDDLKIESYVCNAEDITTTTTP